MGMDINQLQQMPQGAPEQNPEMEQQMMGGQPTGNPEEMQSIPQDMSQMQGGTYQFSQDEMNQPQPQPQEPQAMEMLNEVILQYMDFAIGIKNDNELDKGLKSKIMAEQAGAISSLVPLLTNNGEMEMAKMRHEMDLKYQEHEMDMQIKAQEMEMKKQEMQLKLQMQAQQNQMKMKQQEEQHQTKLVQSEESHQTKLHQQKQAAQSKQGSNSGND